VKVTQGKFQQVAESAESTLERVEKLERWAGAVGSILGRGFWGRLKWLFVGLR